MDNQQELVDQLESGYEFFKWYYGEDHEETQSLYQQYQRENTKLKTGLYVRT